MNFFLFILLARNMTRRTTAIIMVNIFASMAGIIAVIIGAEMYVRAKCPDYDLFNAGYEKPWFRKNPGDLTKVFTIDPDIGFCPIIPGQQYNEFGTLRNDYDIRAPQSGHCRLLFVGDSVTRLGFIVEALRKIYGDQRYEYWNAGVDSFNTAQELNYYKKFNRMINPKEKWPTTLPASWQQTIFWKPGRTRRRVNSRPAATGQAQAGTRRVLSEFSSGGRVSPAVFPAIFQRDLKKKPV